jgi:hypothetical protein
MNFFNILNEKLTTSGCQFTVIGGDWNTTLDNKTARLNIDTLNTVGIPSINRSNWLNTLCRSRKLVDPFRTLHPYKKEFTYVPFAQDSTIRSQLDFFLISDSLITKIVDCRIPNHLSSTLFDHKPVTLTFKRTNPYKKQTINDTILSDPDIDYIVLSATLDTYATHIVPDLVFDDRQLDLVKTRVGELISLLKDLTDLKVRLAREGFVDDYVARCANVRHRITETLDILPTPDFLNSLNLSCNRDVFLEILIMSIKNSCLSYQHNLFKIKNIQKSRLVKKIDNLKLNFNANAGEILRTERELDRIIELELREEVVKMKKFERLNNEKITPYFLSLAKQPDVTYKLSKLLRRMVCRLSRA